jgi:hypothetical protein
MASDESSDMQKAGNQPLAADPRLLIKKSLFLAG